MVDKSFNFIKYKTYAMVFSFIASTLIIIAFFIKGLNLGIDFQGGVVLEFSCRNLNIEDNIKSLISQRGFKFTTLQNKGSHSLVIQLSKDNKCANGCIDTLKSDLQYKYPEASIIRTEYVGPKASKHSIKNSIYAFILAMIMMAFYIVIRFNWRYGVAATVSLIHDVFFTVGFFIFCQYEFNLTSVAAILTIIGYSINDSVVIFDRIRENSNKKNYMLSADLINKSINETLSRTIMTLLTTVAACAVLWLFGGESLRSFGAVTTFGIAFGTYSSIFVASNILLFLKKGHGI